VSLPQVSQIISNCINTATDALGLALEGLPPNNREDPLSLFRAHFPKTNVDLAAERIHTQVSDQYTNNTIASCLASKMLFKEGYMYIS
jgi:glutamate dehydrogenase